ncbi:MAG: Renalase, oxidases 1,2-dihydro- and 1,6-dihydro-beta-NAD(P)H isomers back to NAD(P) [uncultured Rubrobacteraceae bacterium]|uniref:Renalase, oxidases 1,2-dihydro- and 1,6-dihydro-beta-NAD(P)H isomers back to NAD(P) n=1 Tax=uncultured Rubrobacteraceae bacterium TaxID=349277 RepID=A0A6J4Q5E3_9ACTN|nr:MAG: Renalase, oxidases 1,2-dihydro- and 1,6-dihydro-beta-NAD(P)H isomers back to NAD(P) [uncultured Rubrobacteraceae bacterium]
MPNDSCVVVGAGISGLLAARELTEAGWRVTVLDKGRGVGGRMATRRTGVAAFDHGAQFFTVRGERFEDLVDGWLQAGAAAEWSRGFADAEGNANPDGHPRYRGSEGMTSIPKHLADGLDVRTGERVVSVDRTGNGWTVACESGESVSGGALLLTAPVPQSLALAESGNYALPEGARRQLEGISYDPCLALMALLDGSSPVPHPGGVQIKGEPLDWIGDNAMKGISDRPALTIHAGPQWSRAHYDDHETDVTRALLDLAGGQLGADLVSSVVETSLARWRYSWVTSSHEEACLMASEEPPLVFCGDGFGQPKVEGAALSGLAAADGLLGCVT